MTLWIRNSKKEVEVKRIVDMTEEEFKQYQIDQRHEAYENTYDRSVPLSQRSAIAAGWDSEIDSDYKLWKAADDARKADAAFKQQMANSREQRKRDTQERQKASKERKKAEQMQRQLK